MSNTTTAKRKTFPASVPVPDWPSDNRPDSEHSATLKRAGETTAVLKFGAADLGHKMQAPEGTKFVMVYGSVDFDGDAWRVHHTYAVTATGAVAAVVYVYSGYGREEGYYQVSPDSGTDGQAGYLWNIYRSNCTPTLMSGRGISDPLLKSYAGPLFEWLSTLAAEYAASDEHAASLDAIRVQDVNRKAGEYNRKAGQLTEAYAEYSAAVARTEV